MNGQCKKCGSHAVNPHLHGRKPGGDLELCDVCYWRERADKILIAAEEWSLYVVEGCAPITLVDYLKEAIK